MTNFPVKAQYKPLNVLHRYAEPTCSDAIGLVSTEKARKPLFLQHAAKQLQAFGVSADKIPDCIDAEIHLYHTGPLYDEDGSLLDPMIFQASEAFSEGDPGRWVTEFLKRADNPGVRLLQRRCVRRVQFLRAALDIHAARWGGIDL